MFVPVVTGSPSSRASSRNFSSSPSIPREPHMIPAVAPLKRHAVDVLAIPHRDLHRAAHPPILRRHIRAQSPFLAPDDVTRKYQVAAAPLSTKGHQHAPAAVDFDIHVLQPLLRPVHRRNAPSHPAKVQRVVPGEPGRPLPLTVIAARIRYPHIPRQPEMIASL